MTDYTFMKTGLMTPGRDHDRAFQDFVTKILGVITVMLQKAVETAGIFAEHGGYHREITADDIRRAMKVQARTFFKSDDLEERVASVVQDEQAEAEPVLKNITLRKIRRRKVKKDADADDVSYDDVPYDDIPDVTLNLGDVPSDLGLPYNACECTTCRDIRALVDGWDAWDPEDEVEKFLKKHVDQM